MPSIVVRLAPSACTANTVHDLTARPSISTVQAPHWLVSQPTCVPVRFKCSRRKCTSSTRGSTCALRTRPFTVTAICVMSASSESAILTIGTTHVKEQSGRRGVGRGADGPSEGQLVGRMSWTIGDYLTHRFNPDLGIGRIKAIEHRALVVEFPRSGTTLRLAKTTDALAAIDLSPGRPVRLVATREETTIVARQPDGLL